MPLPECGAASLGAFGTPAPHSNSAGLRWGQKYAFPSSQGMFVSLGSTLGEPRLPRFVTGTALGGGAREGRGNSSSISFKSTGRKLDLLNRKLTYNILRPSTDEMEAVSLSS